MSINNYQIGQELGRGTFGVTYYGTNLTTGEPVAIKTIDIAKSIEHGADLSSINEEIQTLQDVSGNEYVANYYESFQGNFNGVDTIFIISEYIDGGSLRKFIQQNQPIAPHVLWSLYLQLLIGLQYIHNKGYAHRDIKPDNILITQNLKIKYIDFGLACLQRCKFTDCQNTCRGTPGTLLYMPPEFFNSTRSNSLEGSKAHDVWSLAVVMFEMANGLSAYPFDALNNGQILDNTTLQNNIAVAPQYQSNYLLDDERTNTYLSTLLINDWKQRPTVDNCIAFELSLLMAPVFANC